MRKRETAWRFAFYLPGIATDSDERPIVIGLAVTAHNNSALNTSTFTGVLVDAPLLLMHSTGEVSPDQGENK